jgi:hypothetical protein
MSNLLKRLEKVEERMNPPDNVPKVGIQVVFIRPDGAVAGRRIIGPGVNEIVKENHEDETD